MLGDRDRSSFLLIVAAVAAIAAAGCKNSDALTDPHDGSPRPTPLPTPVFTSNFDGSWTGTFEPVHLADCDGNTLATAELQQTGTAVTGILTATHNECGFAQVRVEGTVQGTTLTGTVAGGRFRAGTLSGYYYGGTFQLTLKSECPASPCVPGGQMHLHR